MNRLADTLIAIGFVLLLAVLVIGLPLIGYKVKRNRENVKWEKNSNAFPLPPSRDRIASEPAVTRPILLEVDEIPDDGPSTAEINPGELRAEMAREDPYRDVIEAVVVEEAVETAPEETFEEFCERQLREDPLGVGSWAIPKWYGDDESLGFAVGTFDGLVRRGLLTGIGADISTEWEVWDLVPA